MNDDQPTREISGYVLYQSIALDLFDLENEELIKCSTDLYIAFERRKDFSEAIFLHFRQGIIGDVR